MEHSLETLKSCPSCGNDSFSNSISCTDYTYSKKSFSLVKCTLCGLLFTNPRPDQNSIGQYYDNPEYVSHTDTNTGLLFKVYGIVKNFTLGQKRRLVASLANNKTVLDYGAGSGDFSVELSGNNWSVTAYEPDQNARTRILDKDKRIKLVDSISDIESKSKSAITLWHVLEHVHQLTATIKEFHRILADDGTLFIAVPNHTSYDAKFYKEDWAAYDVPRHLYHFEPSTIDHLISANGFTLTKIKPMWFDSFYVSLLSEKNKNSSGLIETIIGWLRAAIIGLISNIMASFDTRKCSSVIYIIKKAV